MLIFAQAGSIDLSFNSSDLGFGNGDGPRLGGLTTSVAIYTTKIQSDGKILVGGKFDTYNGIKRQSIARLNSDGKLDTSFNPGTSVGTGEIRSISIQNDGKIIIVGYFISYNGIARNSIARINSDGSLDTSFDPGLGVGSTIYDTSIQIDGKIIIGGYFATYNGIPRNCIARINSDGSIDTSFNPGSAANGPIYTTSIQSDGKIIIGGNFNTFNTIQKKFLARLNSNGSLDTSFNTGTGLDSQVNTISIQSDGGIIVGGDFTIINGITNKYTARFLNNGSFDPTFGGNSSPYGVTVATCIQTDGKIVVGSILNINGTIFNTLYRMSSNGLIDNTYNPSFNSPSLIEISSISVLNDGKLILGGSVGGNSNLINKCIRLNLDATIDTEFNENYGANSSIYTTAIQNDGKIIIGGDFVNFNGTNRNKIARLNSNGTLENTSNPIDEKNRGIWKSIIQDDGKILIGGDITRLKRLNTNLSLETDFTISPSSAIYGLSLQNDGKIILGGSFSSSTVFPRNLCGRVDSLNSFDNTFNPGFNFNSGYRVNCISSLSSDGKIIISGNLPFLFGVSVGNITRLNPNGSLDTSFSTNNCNSEVICHLDTNDGKIIIGGDFTLCHGTSRNRIARLYSDGTLDTSFNPGIGANGLIRTISIQRDRKIIIGGDFTTYNGVSSNYVARLNTDGTLDTTFNIGTGANGIVRTTSIQSDGKIIIGGDFTSYNGIGRNRIARINNTAALSNNRFKKNILNIFPNPSSGYFTLQIDNLIEMKTVEVYTIIGQKIYSKQLTENESTLDLSNQPKGVYIYKIVGLNREMESGKLVIE